MKILFNKALTAESGVSVSHHMVHRAVARAEMEALVIFIHSWPNEAARLAGMDAAAQWVVSADMQALTLTNGLAEGIKAAVLASPEFTGGTVVADSQGNLSDAKARKAAAVRAWQGAKEQQSFTSAGAAYDADTASRARINERALGVLCSRVAWLVTNLQGLAAAASYTTTALPGNTVSFRRADGVTATLNHGQSMTLQGDLSTAIASAQGTAVTLLAAIDSAADVAAVDAVTVPAL